MNAFVSHVKWYIKYESYSEVVQSQSEREDELKTIKEKFVAIESELENKERKMEQKLNEVIALIQMNPILSNVKSHALLTKRVE